jgi:predicted RNA-binding Zn-ribbon protein involved in translation (DUF1610 family)
MPTKKVIAVQHSNGVIEYECPDCGNYMIGCDTTHSNFSQGEYSEIGGEYLFCQKCGREADYPKPNRIDDSMIPAIG